MQRAEKGSPVGEGGIHSTADVALPAQHDRAVPRGNHGVSALVSLDLAAVYAAQGRTSEMRRLAEQMFPIFESRDVHREALAALVVFREAAQAEQATLALVQEIGAYLRQARFKPDLRFRPSL